MDLLQILTLESSDHLHFHSVTASSVDGIATEDKCVVRARVAKVLGTPPLDPGILWCIPCLNKPHYSHRCRSYGYPENTKLYAFIVYINLSICFHFNQVLFNGVVYMFV